MAGLDELSYDHLSDASSNFHDF
ncbi:hypothetical protein RSAG8_07818, partial [Rhizoctonia solani AG-8 WAC10335]